MATGKRNRAWGWDFAGKHGTAWGAVNLCLTVITVTTLEGVLLRAPWYVAAATTGAGFMATLGWAAFRRQNSAPATVLYQLACWVGAGLWSAWMLARVAEWTWKGWGTDCLILGAAALAGGILAALGAKGSDGESGAGAVMGAEELAGASRVARAEWYEKVVDRLGGRRGDDASSLIDVMNIEDWGNGAGHSVDGKFTSGGFGLAELGRLTGRLAIELDLPDGCSVEVRGVKGHGRRRWIMDVTTKNELGKGAEYPVEQVKEAWTINGPIPIGIRPSGEWMCVELRERNFALYGMTGEGKTVGLKSVLSSAILAADCFPVGVDRTGGDLVNHFMRPFEDGRIDRRPLGATALDVETAERLARALLRIGYARKRGYGDLYREANVSLLPMGTILEGPDGERRILPQVLMFLDETTDILRSINCEHPLLRSYIAAGMQELRGAGVRYVVPPIAGDNQYVGQDIQKLIHTVSCGRMESAGEYKLTLGPRCDIDDAFYAAQGYAMMRQKPGAKLEAFRYFGDATPEILGKVVVKADALGAICDLDPISENAARGITPDGKRWPAGFEYQASDDGWWESRWEGTASAVALPVSRAAGAVAGSTVSTMPDLDALRARAAEAVRAVEEKRAEVEMSGDFDGLPAADPADLAELEGGMPSWLPEIPGVLGWKERLSEALRDAGSEGVALPYILELAAVDRSEVHRWLSDEMKAGRVARMGRGRYAVTPDELS